MVCSVLILNSDFKQSRHTNCRSVGPNAEGKRADRSFFDLSVQFCVDLFVSTQQAHRYRQVLLQHAKRLSEQLLQS